MTLNPSTKRKSSGSPDRKPSKKSKTDGSSLSQPLSPTLWCHVHLEKSIIGSPLKMKNSKISKCPKEELEEMMKIMSPGKLDSNLKVIIFPSNLIKFFYLHVLHSMVTHVV